MTLAQLQTENNKEIDCLNLKAWKVLPGRMAHLDDLSTGAAWWRIQKLALMQVGIQLKGVP